MTFEALRQLGPKVKALKERELSQYVESILRNDLGVPFSKEVSGQIKAAPTRKPLCGKGIRIDFVLYPTEWMYREGIERPIFIELKRYGGSWDKAMAQALDYRMAAFKIKQTGEGAISNFAYEHCLLPVEREEGYMYPERVFIMPDLSGRCEMTTKALEASRAQQYRSAHELLFGTGSVDISRDAGCLFFTLGASPIMSIRSGRSCELFDDGKKWGFKKCS